MNGRGPLLNSAILRISSCIAVAAMLLTGCERQRDRQSTREDISFTSADGFPLAATLYSPAAQRPPGLILLHMYGADRTAWQTFAEAARRGGYMSLAFDLRGHGASTRHRGRNIEYRELTEPDWNRMTADVEAAKQTLIDRGADPENLALVGASIGANLSLIHAVNDADIQAVVMISPGTEYKGLRVEGLMTELRKRPVLLIASDGDSYSASTAAELKREAPGFCELQTYPGTAHGTDILDTARGATPQILAWLDQAIGPGAGAKKAAEY